tara:strand:- start:12637 stop:13857 length:1221 start_codon:yes stop_codon:yes gene_type:complete
MIQKFALVFSSLFFLICCEPFFPDEIDPVFLLDGHVEGLSIFQKSTFVAGDEAFGEVFTKNSGLGPIFNMSSCISCHAGDGKGHPSTNLTRFGKDEDGQFNYMKNQGGPQLQNRSIPGYPAEILPSNITGLSVRSAPIVAGIGFLEAVPDSTLISLSDPNDEDGDGISGRPNYVLPPNFFAPSPQHVSKQNKYYIGRFGRKATTINLLHQTAVAYIEDMGITSNFFMSDLHNPLAGQFSGDGVADPEVSSATISNVVFYLKTLKPPVPRNEEDPDFIAGKVAFNDIGCNSCHIPQLMTGESDIEALSQKIFYPYTDLLLHDMGSELADNYPEGEANGSEWRTTPLWGLGLIKDTIGGIPYYLHDGRTSDLREVIRFHGGEADASRKNFMNLSEESQSQIIKFLESL